MEGVEREIANFLSISSGYGNGCGSGSGYGYGNGCGYGDGNGYGNSSGNGYGDGTSDGNGTSNGNGNGNGCGSGYGYGYGNGYGNSSGDGYGDGDGSGYGITCINGERVYIVDSTHTIIHNVHGNVAQGSILGSDLTLTPCFVCKGEDMFAHGDTLHEAHSALRAKLLENKPIEERIKMFRDHFPDFTAKVANSELYEWHHILTGSCKMGRDSFASDHGIDVENGSMTVNEFIKLTKNSYGGEIIKELNE